MSSRDEDTNTDAVDGLTRMVQDTGAELGIEPEFLFKLLELDDWSFVIQLHALVEGAVTHLLVHSTGERRLQEFYQQLALQNERTGKLAVVRALDLLEPWHVRYIRALASLRNRLAHDVRMVGYVFVTDVADDTRADEFIREFSGGKVAKEEYAAFRPVLRRSPKFYLWMQAMFITAHVYLSSAAARMRRDLVQMKVDRSDNIDGLLDALYDAVERDGHVTFERIDREILGSDRSDK